MTPEAKIKLKHLLISHEKYVQFPYVDTTGHLTVGIGRSLTTRGISEIEAFYLLDEDILYFTSKLNHYLNFFSKLSENRQIALIDMCFNLGVQGFLNFKEFILALEAENWERAAEELRNSKWYEQVGERGSQIENIVLTGNL